MALLWLDGFEGGEGTDTQCRTYLGRRYTVGTSTSINNYTGRYLGICIGCSNNAYVQVDVDQKQTIVVGFAFKTMSLAATDGEALLLLRDAAVTHLEIQLKSTGELKVDRGGVELGVTSGLGLTSNCWYYIEFKVTIDDGTDGSFELKVDGISELSDPACDTNNGGNDYVTRVAFFGDDLTMKYYFDDIYILDTTGVDNNDFLGSIAIEQLDPDGDDTQAWTRSAGTDNYVLVADGGIPDDDTTYVESSVSTTKDLYDYGSNDTDIRDDIKAIAICTELRETDATDYTLKTPIKSGVTENDDAAQAIAGTSFEILERISETDPNTSAKWTRTNLNAAKFGIKVG